MSNWETYYRAGQQAEEKAQHANAMRMYEAAISDAQRFGVSKKHYVSALMGLSRNTGDPATSAQLWTKVLEIGKSENLPAIAKRAYEALEANYTSSHNYEAGCALAADQVSFSSAYNGDESAELGSAYASLAFFESKANKTEQALSHFDQALALLKGKAKAQELAPILEQLGYTQASAGLHDAAVGSLRRAIRLYDAAETDTDRINGVIARQRFIKYLHIQGHERDAANEYSVYAAQQRLNPAGTYLDVLASPY